MEDSRKKSVGIYVRVSTDEQAKEGFSISAQKEKLKAYCVSQGWESFKFYVDEGKSAKDTHRPSLELLLRHIEQGIIDTVLVYRLDRLTRSVRDLYALLDYFDKYNAVFRSATEVYDTGSATGRLFITLVAAMAQWERENLGERVKMGQTEKARQGEYSAPAPFGFIKKGKTLVKNPEQGEILLEIIDKVKKGDSIRKIADYLDNSGILPPKRAYRWHVGTILTILKNPVLYGSFRWDDEMIEDTHEGYISKVEFDRIQEILEERKIIKKRDSYSIFIFQSKIVCSVCGNRLASERAKYFRKKDKKYVENNHYRCQTCVLKRQSSPMGSEKKFEKALVKYMQNVTPKLEPTIPDEKKNDYEKVHQKIMNLEKQRKKYQKAWSLDLMTDQEFEQLMNETKEALKSAHIELAESHSSDYSNSQIDIERAKEIVTMFNENWSVLTNDEKRSIVQELIKYIVFIKEEGEIIITHIEFY